MEDLTQLQPDEAQLATDTPELCLVHALAWPISQHVRKANRRYRNIHGWQSVLRCVCACSQNSWIVLLIMFSAEDLQTCLSCSRG